MIERTEDGQVTWSDLGLWSGKTCPELSAATKGETSRQSSKRSYASQNRKPPILKCLKKAGQLGGDTTMKWEDDGAWLGECMTRNTGESPNAAVVSRLSQILEVTPQEKYSLSAKACQGILRRAERRGKDLPKTLKAVLLMQSESEGGCDGGGKGTLVQQDCVMPSQALTEVASTLRAGAGAPKHDADIRGRLAISCLDMSHACDIIRDCGEIVPSLQARMRTGGNQVPLTYQMQGFGDYRAGEVASSCKQRDFKDSTDLVCAVDCRNFREGGETNGTLQAKSNGGISYNLQNTVRTGMIVRRLTPMECERLQGFPDGWTDIGEWRDSKGKLRKPSDSPRYKALGNSIALPFWDFLAKRISAQYLRPVTMGSLFDGIGGFPLVFERHNGKGTARWASEIEEFPIAVTKKWFGEE